MENKKKSFLKKHGAACYIREDKAFCIISVNRNFKVYDKNDKYIETCKTLSEAKEKYS